MYDDGKNKYASNRGEPQLIFVCGC